MPADDVLTAAATEDPVLAAEREHLDRARECLGQMRAAATTLSDVGGDAFASEMLGKSRAARLSALADAGFVPPFFGRTDRIREAGDDAPGLEDFHIGRRHIRDEYGDPVVIDWRAPMSRPFYQSTRVRPLGVSLRRRFGFAAGELTSYEDEALSPYGDEATAGLADSISPTDAEIPLGRLVVEEIERPRAGPMRDIVATIAPDQDDIVRAPLETSLCIQGSPGTGKTAVGLHRAAYLLYTYPDRLQRSGVLVIGPNDAFLGYIGAVLPALGEVDVTQTTVDRLTARVPVRSKDSDEVAQLKGDQRWAAILRRVVYDGIGKPLDSIQLPLSGRRYRVPVERLRRYVDDVRRSGVPYAVGRERLAMTVAEDARRQKEGVGGAPTDAETRRSARSVEVQDWLSNVWPEVEPRSLVGGLLGERTALTAGSRGAWTDAELDLLASDSLGHNNNNNKARADQWSLADAVLIDEVEGLLRRTEEFGHVILDEAQDLSAMQLRAIARRARSGSVTVLGDIAQGTSPSSTTDWASSLDNLGKPDAVVEVLTRGYRVPGEILDLANRLLPELAPQLPPATSVRPGRGSVSIRPVENVIAALPEIMTAVLGWPGSVGVIAADHTAEPIATALEAAGLASDRVTVLPASLAKGLEYDHVVLVEPSDLVAAEQRGLHRLYVALTRPVTSLTVVHATPLPPQLQLQAG